MTQNKVKKENIITNLDANSKQEVIEKMVKVLHHNGYISDEKGFVAAVYERESQITTGIGNNVAIPHGKSELVRESTVMVAKLKNSVDWNSFDDKPVNLVFLLAIKDEDRGDAHLRILAELSAKLMDDDFLNGVKEASTQEEIYNAVAF
ncbi:MAG: PTS sugar transporter subunit IIA [Micrococcaceae bacterium]